jgi:hypothetical protein
MYASTSALLSKCSTTVILPCVISVTLGREDQMSCVTPAATAASAMALPWAISTSAEALSQTLYELSQKTFTNIESLTLSHRKNGIGTGNGFENGRSDI